MLFASFLFYPIAHEYLGNHIIYCSGSIDIAIHLRGCYNFISVPRAQAYEEVQAH